MNRILIVATRIRIRTMLVVNGVRILIIEEEIRRLDILLMD